MCSKDSPQPETHNTVNEPSKAADTSVATEDSGTSEQEPTKHNRRHYDQHKRHSSWSSSADDLSTWTHISMDRSGATLRTVSTTNDQRSGSERHYRHIPRVDESWEIITHEEIKAMEDADGKAESDDDDEEEWVMVEN